MTYKAKVKVYASKDGKADMKKMIEEKMLTFMVE